MQMQSIASIFSILVLATLGQSDSTAYDYNLRKRTPARLTRTTKAWAGSRLGPGPSKIQKPHKASGPKKQGQPVRNNGQIHHLPLSIANAHLGKMAERYAATAQSDSRRVDETKGKAMASSQQAINGYLHGGPRDRQMSLIRAEMDKNAFHDAVHAKEKHQELASKYKDAQDTLTGMNIRPQGAR